MNDSSYKNIRNQIPVDVMLVAISKTFGHEHVMNIYKQGQHHFGENKVQEIFQKSEQLKNLADIKWHFVGHLQSNKIKQLLQVSGLVMIHSIDKQSLAEKLNTQLEKQQRQMDVLVQVNTSSEESKYGCRPEETEELLRYISLLPNLCVKGLMTIGTLGGDEVETRRCFKLLKDTFDKIKKINISGVDMKILSMGMTNDHKIAVEEGSNCVRIGRAIFGERSLPDSYYWPEKSA